MAKKGHSEEEILRVFREAEPGETVLVYGVQIGDGVLLSWLVRLAFLTWVAALFIWILS